MQIELSVEVGSAIIQQSVFQRSKQDLTHNFQISPNLLRKLDYGVIEHQLSHDVHQNYDCKYAV